MATYGKEDVIVDEQAAEIGVSASALGDEGRLLGPFSVRRSSTHGETVVGA
jgi:hypothetical protein